jgi:hypothetical protein
MAGELPNAHDAVLLGVRVEFETGTAAFRLSLVGDGTRRVSLRCDRFRRIVIDRDQPWGPSASVMAVSGGDERLDIEMQSGDHLLVYGPEMTVSVVNEPEAPH